MVQGCVKMRRLFFIVLQKSWTEMSRWPWEWSGPSSFASPSRTSLSKVKLSGFEHQVTQKFTLSSLYVHLHHMCWSQHTTSVSVPCRVLKGYSLCCFNSICWNSVFQFENVNILQQNNCNIKLSHFYIKFLIIRTCNSTKVMIHNKKFRIFIQKNWQKLTV